MTELSLPALVMDEALAHVVVPIFRTKGGYLHLKFICSEGIQGSSTERSYFIDMLLHIIMTIEEAQ